MNKWYGKIGFADHVETSPGIWEEVITERSYYGDIIRVSRSLTTTGDAINDDVNISNKISIVADPYANQHIFAMRYIDFQGIKWKIKDVEIEYPRLHLSIGGVWNGN